MVAPFTRSSKLTVPHLELEIDCYRLEFFTARLPLTFHHTAEGKEDKLICGEEGSLALPRPPCDYLLMHGLLCSIAHTYNPSPGTKVAAVLFSYGTERRDALLTPTKPVLYLDPSCQNPDWFLILHICPHFFIPAAYRLLLVQRSDNSDHMETYCFIRCSTYLPLYSLP